MRRERSARRRTGRVTSAEQSAKGSEEDRPNHHVIHYVPAARAHRSADRHVLYVAARANEKQIDEIDRADDEEEQRAALHQPEGRTDRAHVIGMQWKQRRAEPASAVMCALGLSFSTMALCASICDCASAIVAPGFNRAIM